jgi:DNA mismatch repair protein MutL
MSGIINILPQNIANQIAAGEVVQRPSSVVKELIENAIDADANSITLVVKDAGKTLVQVIDNGCGMTGEDAPKAFLPHATSKIHSSDDLFNLQTMGFRGEALASIAAVAYVQMKTKSSQEQMGTQIEIQDNEIKSQSSVVCPNGTSISVKNLFFNVPARRSFLKTDTVENNHILDEFFHCALINSSIAFTYYNNGKVLYKLEKESFHNRIVSLFGQAYKERLLPIKEEVDLVKIEGYIVKAEYLKRNRSEQFFFVNGRYFRSAYFANSIQRAYQGLMREGTYPSFFIFLTVNPKDIDVNIHPTKTEIKFLDEKLIYSILYSATKKSLGQFTLNAQIDFTRDISFDVPPLKEGQTPKMPQVKYNPLYNPFEKDTYMKNDSLKQTSTSVDASDLRSETQREILPKYNEEKQNYNEEIFSQNKESAPKNKETTLQSQIAFQSINNTEDSEVIQLGCKYIITTIKGDLLIINQQRASQRVLFEKFSTSCYDSICSQSLLFPFNYFFSPAHSAKLLELMPYVRKYGFMLDYQADGSFNITAAPNNISSEQAALMIEDLLSAYDELEFDTSTSPHYKIALRMSQRLCIKEGDSLTKDEMLGLIGQLFSCASCEQTAFGEKILWRIEKDKVDKIFDI